MGQSETFAFSANPITDLGLPLALEDALTAALDREVHPDIRYAIASEIEDQVGALAESGWDGDCAGIVTAVLAAHPLA